MNKYLQEKGEGIFWQGSTMISYGIQKASDPYNFFMLLNWLSKLK